MNHDFQPDATPSLTPPQYGEDQTIARAFEAMVSGKAEAWQSFDAQTATPVRVGTPCPEPGDWLRLACKELSDAEMDPLLAHAGHCRDCAARLRLSLQVLTAEATAEEAEEIRLLELQSTDWTRRLARDLAQTPRRTRSRWQGTQYLWAGSALAASLLLSVGFSAWWNRQHSPERLLAQAYSDSRFFDLRMNGAGYADVHPGTHLRGGGGGHEASTLLDARTRITRKLESSPDDPHWLQLAARADILEEKFDTAVDILDRLLAAGPVTTSLLLDDAAAYYERGTISGSESDRAMALDALRRADELAPDDPVVLFNEAIVMEDRGQRMNAVETWNRFLRFEKDAQWQAEGRRRLQALEESLNQMKSHQSRMEQHLSTPRAMRALASNPQALAAVDEEFSTSMLAPLLRSAYAIPVDRSRGSPCAEGCQAARELLAALAKSLEQNHQDNWLTRFLPSPALPSSPEFLQGAQALARAMDSNASGDYQEAVKSAAASRAAFQRERNELGEARAEVERIYALQRSTRLGECYAAAGKLLTQAHGLAWIEIQTLTEEGVCDSGPGSANRQSPSTERAEALARQRHYLLLQMRARNILGGAALESGDAESAWKNYLGTVRMYFGGDYPPFRLYTSLAGLAEVEKSTPRKQLELLLQRETIGTLELSQGRGLIPSQRYDLAIAAIRAGQIPEALQELNAVRRELKATEKGQPVPAFVADSEIAMANLYLERGALSEAGPMLDSARLHLAGQSDPAVRQAYAAARGQLELARQHPESADALLQAAILEEESRGSGSGNVPNTLEDHDLYAVLAGVWLAEARPAEDILALWERYRLRLLGEPVPACPHQALTCLRPRLNDALARLGRGTLDGQVVLLDRLLLFRATAQGVHWSTQPISRSDLMAAVEPLQRAVGSPRSSRDSVDFAARRLGDLLLGNQQHTDSDSDALTLEPDPQLNNLPWPVLKSSVGAIGLHFHLQETPSILLSTLAPPPASGRAVIVGAATAEADGDPLPEVLDEAQAIAHFSPSPHLLLSEQASRSAVIADLAEASLFHFAGHSEQQDGSTRLMLAPALRFPAPQRKSTAFLDSATLRHYPPHHLRLAVLSACSTGRREDGNSLGMSDLVDTLASLHVPEVVATRWQLDSAAAVPLMQAFYTHLAQGESAPQALTSARRALANDARYQHPYYWASAYASGWLQGDLRAQVRIPEARATLSAR